MSIEDIVRTSMDEIVSDLAPTIPEPAALRARVDRGRRVRSIATVGLVAAVAAAALVGTGAFRDNRSQERPTGPVSTSNSLGSRPVDLKSLQHSEPLPAGRYAMPIITVEGPMRAIVDVPNGYFNTRGWVIDDGNDRLAPHQYGDLAFWGGVDEVYTDPCGSERYVDAGTSVHDLAAALVAQHHRTTSQPVAVTVDGYRGIYLTATGTENLDSCTGQMQTIFHANHSWATTMQDDMANTVDHMWILNVRGQRIVAVARVIQGHTSHPAQLVQMAESARFTFGDQP